VPKRLLGTVLAISTFAAPVARGDPSTLDDMDLRSNVESSIRGTATTAALHLKIEVRGGVAIPTGRVRNLALADQVVDLAAKVPGIRDVDRSGMILEIDGGADEEVAKAVSRALSDVPKFAAAPLTVEVKGGIATVAGPVPSGTFRAELRNVVGTVDGVIDLVDRLVTPETPDQAIARVLEATFAPRAVPRFPGSVRASVRAGVVTLEGRVPRLYDRRAAEARAFAINGVREVDNRLELSGSAVVKVVNP